MAGYTPWMAGAAAAAKRANKAAAARDRAAKRAEYDEYVAEAKACGFEFCSFKEWLGETDPREAAESRVMGGMDWPTFNYYADLF